MTFWMLRSSADAIASSFTFWPAVSRMVMATVLGSGFDLAGCDSATAVSGAFAPEMNCAAASGSGRGLGCGFENLDTVDLLYELRYFSDGFKV